MRTTASVSRTHARDGVSRDHHTMCFRQFTPRRKALKSEGAARRRARSRSRGTCCGARLPSRPPSPSTSPSSASSLHAGLPAPACTCQPPPPPRLARPASRAAARTRARAPLQPQTRRRAEKQLQPEAQLPAWGRRGGGSAASPLLTCLARLAHRRPGSGPELKLRLSHRRVGAERGNCSHRQP